MISPEKLEFEPEQLIAYVCSDDTSDVLNTYIVENFMSVLKAVTLGDDFKIVYNNTLAFFDKLDSNGLRKGSHWSVDLGLFKPFDEKTFLEKKLSIPAFEKSMTDNMKQSGSVSSKYFKWLRSHLDIEPILESMPDQEREYAASRIVSSNFIFSTP